jgi:hypothetical protein
VFLTSLPLCPRGPEWPKELDGATASPSWPMARFWWTTPPTRSSDAWRTRCAPREAGYVLDGLLENDTLVRPLAHTTDTHGFTEQLFGLCHLLGIAFMPRQKDLPDQQLYKLDKNTDCTAPGFLDNRLRYAARLKVWSCQAARMASGLRWPFFSINHSAL